MLCTAPISNNEEGTGKVKENGHGRLSAFLERIVPAQSGKAGEIAICGAQCYTMVDRQGSKMRIGHEIGARGGLRQQGTEDVLMPLSRLRDP